MPKEVATTPTKTAQALIESMSDRIAQVLPKHLTAERMVRVFCNAVAKKPQLAQCDRMSFAESIITASEFGLEPNTPVGQCYIIPYGKQATFQIGYQGLMELAYRSGKVRSIRATTVYERDNFELVLGLHPDIKHVAGAGNRGEPIGYYGVLVIDGTDPHFAYMTKADVTAHAKKFSKSYAKEIGPWSQHFEAMAHKTVIIQACKLAPKSIDDKFSQAIYANTDVAFDGPIVEASARPTSLDDLADDLTANVDPGVDTNTGEILPDTDPESAEKAAQPSTMLDDEGELFDE